jgi:anti-sigma B factor antagonist
VRSSSNKSITLATETYVGHDVIILRCRGNFVAGEETSAFRQGAEKLLSESRRVVINLTDLDQIDSTGLAVLVHLLTWSRGPEGEVRLVSARRYLTDLLRRTRLDSVITTYTSEEEAIASFAKRSLVKARPAGRA